MFIAVKDDVISSRMEDLESECEILWTKIDIVSCKPLYIAAYYRPDATDAESLEQLAVSMDKLPQGNSHIWLAGDMNLPGIDWPSTDLKTSCCSPAQHNRFLDILADRGMTQMIDQPTRGENTLDLIAVNNPTLVNRTEVLPGISDHDIVFAEIDICPKRYKQTKRKIPIYKKGDWKKVEEEMNSTYQYIRDNAEIEDVDTLWLRFKKDLKEAIDKHIPHKNCSAQNKPPWITAKVRKLLNARDRCDEKSPSWIFASRIGSHIPAT